MIAAAFTLGGIRGTMRMLKVRCDLPPSWAVSHRHAHHPIWCPRSSRTSSTDNAQCLKLRALGTDGCGVYRAEINRLGGGQPSQPSNAGLSRLPQHSIDAGRITTRVEARPRVWTQFSYPECDAGNEAERREVSGDLVLKRSLDRHLGQHVSGSAKAGDTHHHFCGPLKVAAA